ncbi:MAG TPA: hypothetical protein VG125_28140 [Pirellulales bacterium]|jgi:hypothetical protein|nr:hypothetical protein [Pirellulales bacterium]
MNLPPVLCSALIATFFGQASIASAKIARNWNDLGPGPRVVGYDREKDVLFHQSSVVSGVVSRRPGGEHSYSGNRLEAFQYHGKPGTGGLYDALEDYKNKLNPHNYRYRHR